MDRIIILYAKMNIMTNDTANESEKILELLFEPDNAEILVELKDGPKLLSFLTKKIAISKEELDEKLSYLIEKGFVSKNEKNNDISYLLDTEKLSKALENDDNFSSSFSFEIAIFFVRTDSSFGPSFNSTRISAMSGSNNDSRIFSLSFEASFGMFFILIYKIIIVSINHIKIIPGTQHGFYRGHRKS